MRVMLDGINSGIKLGQVEGTKSHAMGILQQALWLRKLTYPRMPWLQKSPG